jgi:hypothetical protein
MDAGAKGQVEAQVGIGDEQDADGLCGHAVPQVSSLARCSYTESVAQMFCDVKGPQTEGGPDTEKARREPHELAEFTKYPLDKWGRRVYN